MKKNILTKAQVVANDFSIASRIRKGFGKITIDVNGCRVINVSVGEELVASVL